MTKELKPAIVMFGRFQPPTIGHYHVIDRMKEYMREHRTEELKPFIVIIAGEKSSKDKAENPLTAQEREKFIRASGYADGVKVLVANDMFAAIHAVQDEGYRVAVVAAGSDRAERYLKILRDHFSTKAIALSGLERTEASTLRGIPISGVSGSLARLAVEHDDRETFARLTGTTDKPKLAQIMFDKIKTRQGD